MQKLAEEAAIHWHLFRQVLRQIVFCYRRIIACNPDFVSCVNTIHKVEFHKLGQNLFDDKVSAFALSPSNINVANQYHWAALF